MMPIVQLPPVPGSSRSICVIIGQQKNPSTKGRVKIRGATLICRRNLREHKIRRPLSRYGECHCALDTLGFGNGALSGHAYSPVRLSGGGSQVHSVVCASTGSHLARFSGTPLEDLLFLFNAFSICNSATMLARNNEGCQ